MNDVVTAEIEPKRFYQEARATVFSREDDPIFNAINTFHTSGLTPKEKYPGVTRVLSATKDQTGLQVWRDRVGELEADRILAESQVIGTSLDMIIEKSFSADFVQISYKDEVGYKLYLQLKKHLAKVDPIALQLKLWSDKLKVMGFIDCLGYYDGKLSLIDFKNSRSEKKEEYVEDYYLQCTLYCMMLYELTGVSVKQIVLLIAVRNSAFPQILIKKTGNYIEKSLSKIKDYNRVLSNAAVVASITPS